MSFAIFKGETTMKDLVTRLFRLPDKSAKTLKQASDALLQANPQLASLSKVPVGTVIEIPSTAPPLNPSQEAPAIAARQVAISRQAQQVLADLNQKLAEIDARAADDANTFLSLAQSKDAKAFAQKSPQFKALLPALIDSAKSAAQGVKAQQDVRTRAATDLQARLQSLPQMKS